MPGAFDASAEFGHDPLPTAEEIQHSGQNVLRWLEQVATSEISWPVDVRLVQEIHFLTDSAGYESAWWSAGSEDHAKVDAVVLDELAKQEQAGPYS